LAQSSIRINAAYSSISSDQVDLHVPIPGLSHGIGIVATLGADVETQPFISSIDDLIKDRLVAAPHVHRFEDVNVHRIFDATTFVLRRLVNVDDDLVVQRRQAIAFQAKNRYLSKP